MIAAAIVAIFFLSSLLPTERFAFHFISHLLYTTSKARHRIFFSFVLRAVCSNAEDKMGTQLILQRVNERFVFTGNYTDN